MSRLALAGLPLVIATAAAAQDTPIRVAMHYTEEQAAPLLACFDRYEAENEGVSVDYQQITYGDYLQTVLTSRIGGQAPDIYNVYQIWGAQMVDNAVLAEVPDDLARTVRDGYAEGTVEAATISGTLWGVPTEVSVYMLVSNMALLEAAGHSEPPTTWEDFKTVAGDVTSSGGQGRIEQAGFAFADSSSGAGVVHPFYALLFSEGASPYADGFAEAQLGSEASVDVAGRMASLVSDGITDRTVDAYDDFPAGGVGMMIMANWYESTIREGLGDGFDKVRVSQIPMGEDWKTLQYAFFMGVDANSQVQDAAWKLIGWVNSPESASEEGGPSCVGEMLAGMGALTANAADIEAMGEMDDFTRPYWEALQSGRAVSQPNVLQASEIEGMIAQALDEVISGGAEPGAAMERLNGRVDDVLSEFY